MALLLYLDDSTLPLIHTLYGWIKYHFWSFWYDASWDWTSVSRTNGKHSTHKSMVFLLLTTVDYGVISIKGYLTLPRSPELESHDQMNFRVLTRTFIVFYLAMLHFYKSNNHHISSWLRNTKISTRLQCRMICYLICSVLFLRLQK